MIGIILYKISPPDYKLDRQLKTDRGKQDGGYELGETKAIQLN